MNFKNNNFDKKVGIITYHDGINYGAFFQATSLYKVLTDKFKVDVEFVNYKSLRHRLLENLVFYHKIYDLQYLKNNIFKIYKFRKAQAQFKESRKIIFKNQLLRSKYNYIIYGSDEIWNYKNPLVGYNSIYFGHYSNSTKISYAPSFGSIEDKTALPTEIINGLSSFKYVSVRDRNSQRIISRNLKRKAPIVLDPTLLINDTLRVIRPKDKEYILVYTTKISNQIINYIREFAFKKKKKLIAVGYAYSWCDKSYVNIGPEEWLGFYKNADFVVTSMFHGTIYAIKNKKNFVTIITKYRKNKLSSFMKYLKLEDRVLSDPENLGRILSKKPNYQKIFRDISVKRKESLNFLRKSLEYDK